MPTTETTFQTRIITKHDDLSAWESSSLQLAEGEVVLAKLNVPQKDGTLAPTFIAKVGVGEGKTFKDSPWLFAHAADVYKWAKQSTLPIEFASTYDETYNSISNIQFLPTTNHPDGAIVITKEQHEHVDTINSSNNSITIDKTNPTQLKLDVNLSETTGEYKDTNKLVHLRVVTDGLQASVDLSEYLTSEEVKSKLDALNLDGRFDDVVGSFEEGIAGFNEQLIALQDRVTTIEETTVTVKTDENSVSTLTFNDDIIIFDCGGVE